MKEIFLIYCRCPQKRVIMATFSLDLANSNAKFLNGVFGSTDLYFVEKCQFISGL